MVGILNLNQLDLNLLLAFDALIKTRSVTLAGERIGLSQSATSNCLQRLRDAFGDPLFVRTPQGMQPTALAAGMADEISEVLARLKAVLERQEVFDPSTARRAFRVLISDIAQITLLPGLMNVLRERAPGVDLINVSMPLREAKDALASGELDLAVGFIPSFGPDYHKQALDDETWTCLVRKDHPTIGDTLTQDEYFAASHIIYAPPGSIHVTLDKMLDAQFERGARKRRIALSVPYFSGLVSVVARTDLVLTAPLRLSQNLITMSPLKILPLPFEVPPMALNMQWHGQVHRDPANIWFRRLFAKSYLGRNGVPTPEPD